ncbi:MAG: hypothetical protein ABUL72_00705, partial [Armatimonadota bacterium]
MESYFVLGVDGKEYGPVTSAQVAQWMAEGRVLPNTQLRAASNNAVFSASQVVPMSPGATPTSPAGV